MKKVLIIAAAAAALCSCTANKYAVNGTIEGLEGTVYMYDDKENVLDSTAVENGAFSFKGVAEAPAVRYLSDSNGDQPGNFSAMLILEPGKITITPNPENPAQQLVTGTPANDARTAYSQASNTLIKEYRAPETEEARRMAIEDEYNDLTKKTVEANYNNLFGALLLAQQLAYELSGSELLEQIAKFSPEMQQTEILTKLKETAEQKAKTEVGKPYINIMQSNAEGEVVTLTSVIENPANKYTLVDFWASWCGPCMGEVPVLKKTYDEFHAKGFEIYGVSFDKDREKWLGAIQNEGLNWIHVSDLNGFDNPAAKDYAVRGIPSNFLIDAQGTIVASNLRGEELYQKIAELLK